MRIKIVSVKTNHLTILFYKSNDVTKIGITIYRVNFMQYIIYLISYNFP